MKLLQGTFRPGRELGGEPMPESAIPEIPAHLSEEAQAEWFRISQELYKIGLLSQIDRAALAAYCEAWADWVDASRMCASKDGQDRKVIKSSNGNFFENPYYTIKKRSMELMHKFLTEFGMTPASRTRISTSPPVSGGQKTGTGWGGFGS